MHTCSRPITTSASSKARRTNPGDVSTSLPAPTTRFVSIDIGSYIIVIAYAFKDIGCYYIIVIAYDFKDDIIFDVIDDSCST